MNKKIISIILLASFVALPADLTLAKQGANVAHYDLAPTSNFNETDPTASFQKESGFLYLSGLISQALYLDITSDGLKGLIKRELSHIDISRFWIAGIVKIKREIEGRKVAYFYIPYDPSGDRARIYLRYSLSQDKINSPDAINLIIDGREISIETAAVLPKPELTYTDTPPDHGAGMVRDSGSDRRELAAKDKFLLRKIKEMSERFESRKKYFINELRKCARSDGMLDISSYTRNRDVLIGRFGDLFVQGQKVPGLAETAALRKEMEDIDAIAEKTVEKNRREHAKFDREPLENFKGAIGVPYIMPGTSYISGRTKLKLHRVRYPDAEDRKECWGINNDYFFEVETAGADTPFTKLYFSIKQNSKGEISIELPITFSALFNKLISEEGEAIRWLWNKAHENGSLIRLYASSEHDVSLISQYIYDYSVDTKLLAAQLSESRRPIAVEGRPKSFGQMSLRADKADDAQEELLAYAVNALARNRIEGWEISDDENLEREFSLKHMMRAMMPEAVSRIGRGDILIIGLGRHTHEIELMFKLFPDIRSVSIVDNDIGNLLHIRFKLHEMTGIDGRKVKFHLADCGKLPFNDGTFDACYSHGVLEDSRMIGEKTLSKQVGEVKRVLKQDGVYMSIWSDPNIFEEHGFSLHIEGGATFLASKDENVFMPQAVTTRSKVAMSFLDSVKLAASNAKKENRRIIIGFDTSGWLPNAQQGAVQPLITEVLRLQNVLAKMGLDNVLIVRGAGDELAFELERIRALFDIDMKNVVVLASETALNSRAFDIFRSADGHERAFLAGVDPKYLEEMDYAQLLEMLTITINLAFGDAAAKADDKDIMIQYIGKRLIRLIPMAEPKDYERLKGIYESQRKALVAA
jgi:hypothetical protein